MRDGVFLNFIGYSYAVLAGRSGPAARPTLILHHSGGDFQREDAARRGVPKSIKCKILRNPVPPR